MVRAGGTLEVTVSMLGTLRQRRSGSHGQASWRAKDTQSMVELLRNNILGACERLLKACFSGNRQVILSRCFSMPGPA
jgi:hypothetical protein